MNKPNSSICQMIQSRIQETMKELNKKDSIIEADPLDSELRILDWIFYQVCKDQQNHYERHLVELPKIVIFQILHQALNNLLLN
jgi:hypothetical protein